jgi:hypothetical protein
MEGEWDVDGTVELRGQIIPVSGTEKVTNTGSRIVEDIDLMMDIDGKKIPFKSSYTTDIVETERNRLPFQGTSTQLGEGSGTLELLPDCTHSVKLSDKLSITEHGVQMWLNNKEIKTVSYSMDDNGKRTGSMTVYKRKRN